MTGLAAYGYPSATQQINACATPSVNTYPTVAIACPWTHPERGHRPDGRHARLGRTAGQVENQTIVYRYQPSGPDGTVFFPYQYTSTVG